MRLQSNHARGPFQQLRLAIQRGLTYRLYVLYHRIGGIKSELEVSQNTLPAHHIPNKPVLAGDRQATTSYRRLGECHQNSGA